MLHVFFSLLLLLLLELYFEFKKKKKKILSGWPPQAAALCRWACLPRIGSLPVNSTRGDFREPPTGARKGCSARLRVTTPALLLLILPVTSGFVSATVAGCLKCPDLLIKQPHQEFVT